MTTPVRPKTLRELSGLPTTPPSLADVGLISGGSFDGFTGVWHFEGTFTPTS